MHHGTMKRGALLLLVLLCAWGWSTAFAEGEGSSTGDATLLSIGERLGGMLDTQGDADWFAIQTSSEPAYYAVEIKNVDIKPHSVVSSGFMATLYDSQGDVLEAHDNIKIDEPVVFSHKLPPDSTCHLMVTMDENGSEFTGSYQITVQAYADAAGNSMEEALEIPLEERYSGTLDGTGDVDFLRVHTSEIPSFYAFEIKNVDIKPHSVVSSGFMATLYDLQGDVLETHDDLRIDEPVIFSHKLDTETDYYLALAMDENGRKFTGGYQITPRVYPDAEGDTPQDATALTFSERFAGSLDGTEDVDYLRFDTDDDADTFYLVDVKNVDITPHSVVRSEFMAGVYDGQGDLLGKSMELDTEKSGQLSFKLAPNATCYIKVAMDENGTKFTGNYQVTVTPRKDAQGDTQETAAEARLGEKTAGNLDGMADVDYFRFTTSAEEGPCTVELHNINVPTDGWDIGYLEIVAYSAAGDRIESTRADQETARSFSFDPAAGTEYFLKVAMTSPDYSIVGEYEIRICMGDAHYPAEEWQEKTWATCESEGLRVKACTVCRQPAISEAIPATGHTPGEWEQEAEATCTEEGKRVIRCTTCYAELEAEEQPALGHTFGEWAVTQEPTREQEGEQQRVCETCGETESEAIEKLKGWWQKLVGG